MNKEQLEKQIARLTRDVIRAADAMQASSRVAEEAANTAKRAADASGLAYKAWAALEGQLDQLSALEQLTADIEAKS